MRSWAFLLVLALVAAGCASAPGSAPQPDEAAPDWSFTALDGSTHSRDSPPGNATVLFFMATWCGSCRTKAPILAAVHGDVRAQGVRFYSLDFDPTETTDDLRAWQEERAQPWPHGIDQGLTIQRTFGVKTQSSVVVLDADGRVVQAWGYGAVTESGLRDAIARALSA